MRKSFEFQPISLVESIKKKSTKEYGPRDSASESCDSGGCVGSCFDSCYSGCHCHDDCMN